MPELSEVWRPAPDWATASLNGDGIAARALLGLDQCLVSGDIAAFRSQHGLAPDVGALGAARGPAYAVRMARDRILAIGLAETAAEPGWRESGFALTSMSAALHVFEFKGRNVLELVARATTIDPADPGPCAALPFAGVLACLYRHDDDQTLRLHIDRGLAVHVWTWLQNQPLFA